MLHIHTVWCPWRTKTLPLKTQHGKQQKTYLNPPLKLSLLHTISVIPFKCGAGALHKVVKQRGLKGENGKWWVPPYFIGRQNIHKSILLFKFVLLMIVNAIPYPLMFFGERQIHQQQTNVLPQTHCQHPHLDPGYIWAGCISCYPSLLKILV